MRESEMMAKEMPILDHVNQSVFDKLLADGGPRIYTLTPEQARNSLLRAQSAFSKPEAIVKDLTVNSGELALRLRTIRPTTIPDGSGVIMYFHGAGSVMGDSTTHDRLVRALASGAGAMLVFVDYDRAPEHRYPVAIEQA